MLYGVCLKMIKWNLSRKKIYTKKDSSKKQGTLYYNTKDLFICNIEGEDALINQCITDINGRIIAVSLSFPKGLAVFTKFMFLDEFLQKCKSEIPEEFVEGRMKWTEYTQERS